MSLTLNFAYCYTGFIGGGLILHVCQYVFQNHVKSRKIYMYMYATPIYDYTHDQFYYTFYYHFL